MDVTNISNLLTIEILLMKKFYESLMLRDFTKIVMLIFSTDIINNFFKIKKNSVTILLYENYI